MKKLLLLAVSLFGCNMNNVPTIVPDGGVQNPVLEEGLYHLTGTLQETSSVGTCDWVQKSFDVQVSVDSMGNVIPDALPGLTEMLKCKTEYPEWEQVAVSCEGFGGTLQVKGHMEPGMTSFASGFSVAKGDIMGCTRVGVRWQAELLE